MPLSHMRNPETIRRAVAAFEELGRDAFPLISTATGKAVDYFLVIDGKRYDSRAIVGVAHGYEFPEEGHYAPGLRGETLGGWGHRHGRIPMLSGTDEIAESWYSSAVRQRRTAQTPS